MAASTESQPGFPEWEDGSVDIPVCAPQPSRVDGQHAGNSGTQNGGQLAANADGKAARMNGNHSGAQLTRNVDGTHAGADRIPSGARLAGEIDGTNAVVDGQYNNKCCSKMWTRQANLVV